MTWSGDYRTTPPISKTTAAIAFMIRPLGT